MSPRTFIRVQLRALSLTTALFTHVRSFLYPCTCRKMRCIVCGCSTLRTPLKFSSLARAHTHTRARTQGEETERDCVDSLGTLFEVLYTLTKLMAPFTPFLAENMYQNLRKGLAHPDTKQDDRSVHYLLSTEPKPEYFNPAIQTRVARMQAVVELARVIRERKTLPVKVRVLCMPAVPACGVVYLGACLRISLLSCAHVRVVLCVLSRRIGGW